jgi:hypothetical protein
MVVMKYVLHIAYCILQYAICNMQYYYESLF